MSFLNFLSKVDKVTRFLIFIIVLTGVYTAILRLVGSHPNALTHIKWMSFGEEQHNDSWNPMIEALQHVKQSPESPVYQAILFKEGTKFQYPPSSLLVFDIPRFLGFEYATTIMLLDFISLISIFLIAFVSSKILTLTLAKYDFPDLGISSPIKPILQHIIIFTLTIMFYPLMYSYHLGQIQTLLTLFATLATYFWLHDKKRMAGFLIGLITVVKPQIGLLFVWGTIRRQWDFVLVGGVTIAIITLISIFLYGFDNHLDYLSALSFLSRHGEAYYPNQSINGLMNRLLFNGNNLIWESNDFPPFSYPVYLTTFISSLILIFLGLFWHHKDRNPNGIDFCIAMLCITMASPIAWKHHYGILLPFFIMLTPFACHFYRNRKVKLTILALAYLLASQYTSLFNRLADSHLNILQSYLLFAIIMILSYAFSISHKLRKHGLTKVA